MEKIALITGATSGIGRSTAEKLADEGWNVIITGRRRDRLEVLQQELLSKGVRAHSLCFDIRSQEEVDRAVASLPNEWHGVRVLVNNAGLASGLATIDDGDVEDWDKMIDTNVKGLLYMTRAMIPLLKASGNGHILNIGSTAGKETYLNGNVYCATKHAVDSLTKGFRIDLLPHGIKVTGICPGMVETEFSLVRFHGDADRATQVYQGFEPLTPEDVAEVIHYAIDQPKHVCLNDITLTATAQANSFYTNRKS